MSERKKRKDAGKGKRFRVYVQSITTGHCTRGRYYNRGPDGAWKRATMLRNLLTDKFKVIIFHIEKREIVTQTRGYMRYQPSQVCIFSPVQCALAKK